MAFRKAAAGAFIGRVLATLVIAFCAALGFGPEDVVAWMLRLNEGSPWLLAARIVFGLAAFGLLVAMGMSWWLGRQPSDDCSELTKAQLREQGITWASKMREFGAKVYAAQMREAMGSARRLEHGKADTPQLRHFKWVEQNEREQKVRSQYGIEFKTQYRPRALALCNEIRKRLGMVDSEWVHDYRSQAIARGSLSGPDPISASADYLEELARKL